MEIHDKEKEGRTACSENENFHVGCCKRCDESRMKSWMAVFDVKGVYIAETEVEFDHRFVTIRSPVKQH